jgi:hypothetical protein
MNIFYRKLILAIFLGVFLIFINISICIAVDESNVSEKKEESIEELTVKLKALQTARQINTYLSENPDLTLKDLQKDINFKNIAVQKVGENGYTFVVDMQSGYFYFHPQEKLLNTDSHDLKNTLPDFWRILSQAISLECKEASGHYNWIEADGQETEKYLYTACVNHKTADGKDLFVGATAYIDESVASKYLEKYNVKKNFAYSKDAIKQRALDISKQIELYIRANPQKSFKDFEEDLEFQELAVQQVGETGYTYLITHETGFLDFHPDPKIEKASYDAFKDKFPIIWDIIDKSVKSNPCKDSDGFYEWADIDGNIRYKYTYHHCINAQTADGFSFFLGASTYLDEYKNISEEKDQEYENEKNILNTKTTETLEEKIDLVKLTYWFIAFIFLIFLILYVLYYFHVIRLEGKSIMILLGATSLIIIVLFIFNAYQMTESMKANSLESYKEQQMFLAGQIASSVENELNKITNDIQISANNSKFLSKDKIDGHDRLERLLSRIKKYCEGVTLLDSKGMFLDHVFSQEEYVHDSTDYSKKPGVVEVIETGEASISNIFKSALGNMGFSFVMPVKRSNTLEAIIRVNIHLSSIFENHLERAISDRVLMSRLVTGNKVYGFDGNIGDTSPNLVAYLREGEAKHFQDIPLYLDNEKYEKSIFLKTYYPLNLGEKKWGIVLATPMDSIYSSLRGDVNRIWYFTISIIMAIFMIAFIFNFILTKSLKKDISNKTKEVEESNKIISEQLKKEEIINNEKENLIKKQKESQNELEEKLEELEGFQKVTMNRELKMIELKKEIKKLKKK